MTFDVNKGKPNHYVLMTTQTADVDYLKCGYNWESSQFYLDIVTRFELPGNPGSRLLADDILEEVKNRLVGMQLDAASNLEIITITNSFPGDLTTTTNQINVFRKLFRLEFYIV